MSKNQNTEMIESKVGSTLTDKMKIYKVMEKEEWKGGETHVLCKVFQTKKDAQNYYLKEKVEIRKCLKENGIEGEKVEEYTYGHCVVFYSSYNYITLYKVIEDELN